MRNSYWLRLWLVLSLVPRTLLAQETFFSQYRMSPLQVNPAEAATSSDWRVLAHYRSQHMEGDVGFRSTQFTAVRPLFWGKRRYAGVGISVLDDRSGNIGWFRFQRIGLSLAHDVPLSRRQYLSLGVQARYQIKRITTEGVRTGSQFRPGGGFDPSLVNGEGVNGLQTNYLSLDAGLLWYAIDRHEQTAAYAGLSLADLNRPDDGFLVTSPVPMALQIHGGFRLLERGRTIVQPEGRWTYGASGHLLNLGSRFSYRLGSRYAKAATASRLDIVPRYTINRSASLALQWHSPSYTLGVSYDTDASFRAGDNPLRSAFEIVVAWRQPVTLKEHSGRKKKRRARQRTPSRASEVAVRRLRRVVSQPPTPFAGSLPLPRVAPVAVALPAINRGLLSVQRLTLTTEFAFNRTTLSPSSVATLQEIADFLKGQPNVIVTLVGHADRVGSVEANRRISEQRAAVVRNFLVRAGSSVGAHSHGRKRSNRTPVSQYERSTAREEPPGRGRVFGVLIFETVAIWLSHSIGINGLPPPGNFND